MSDQARARAEARAEALAERILARAFDGTVAASTVEANAVDALLRYRDECRREALAPLVELRALSDAVDHAANGTTEYQIRLIALASATRSVLRRFFLEEPV